MRGPTLTLVLGLLFAQPAGAQSATGFEAPDSARLSDLNQRLRTHRYVRVGITGASVNLYRARATEVGLEYEGVMLENGISYVTADDPEAPQLEWNRIGSIEARGHGTDVGTIVGLVVGGTVGWRVASTWSHGDELVRPVSVVLLTSLGAAYGAGLGAEIGGSLDPWRPLYP